MAAPRFALAVIVLMLAVAAVTEGRFAVIITNQSVGEKYTVL